jgi:hypothetical protein
MNIILLLACTWVINGSIKFAVNTLRSGKEALALIGYGGFPSTHTAMVAAALFYVGFHWGFNTPSFAALAALLWVVMNDAMHLRIQVGSQAAAINRLTKKKKDRLRERMGHSKIEVLGGLVVGGVIGFLWDHFSIVAWL